MPLRRLASAGPIAAIQSLLLALVLGSGLSAQAQVPSNNTHQSILKELGQKPSPQLVQLGKQLSVPAIEPEITPGAENLKKALKHYGKKYDIRKIGERGIGKGMNFYSLEKEQALGKEMASEVEQSVKLVKDPVINEYINRLGQNLVLHSDAKVPFTIKVIDSDEINAFALPGGYFYVNTGLIMAADSESELAGVMAHEIAHVAARHATRNLTKGQLWNFASIPLIFVGGPVGMAVQQAAGLAIPMSMMKFSRNAEREADLLGIEYQYASGYDPASFVDFFEKLKAKEKHKMNFIAKAFSTHPMTKDRVERAEKEIEQLLPPRPQYVVDTSEFQEIKARLGKLLNRDHMRLLRPGESKPTLHHTEVNNGPPKLEKRDGNDDGRPTLKRPTDN